MFKWGILTSMLEQLLVIPFPENVEVIFTTYRTKLRHLSEKIILFLQLTAVVVYNKLLYNITLKTKTIEFSMVSKTIFKLDNNSLNSQKDTQYQYQEGISLSK